MKKTGAEKAKEWRKNNPEKIKAYLERTKKHRKEVREKYYSKNRYWLLENERNKLKETNYKRNKSGKRKEDNTLRSVTRNKYPIKGEKCAKCGKDAEQRHHTTEPKEADKFIFVCKKCHYKIHGMKDYAKEVKNEK